MISIGKNHYKALVTITALASVLIVNAMAIGTDGHIALARHHDNTKVFENSHINVQTDTDQRQACETAGDTSPISDSCTDSSSSDTIPQCTPLSSLTATTVHPTVLTLVVSPTQILSNGANKATVSGTLIDTVTGARICGATITIATPGPAIASNGRSIVNVVTAPDGTFSTTFMGAGVAGDAPLNAAFAGAGIYGPSFASTLLIITPSAV
jgi:hypothetical protein